MAVGSDSIWAVDLGNYSLKALHLMGVGDQVQVIGFDHIPHGKIVSSSGVSPAEREELIAISLRQFVQRNEIGYEPLIVSVPSQNSFARFVTLPPVEARKIPEIVQFEAAQQIPFDINEVQWDWQLLSDPDSTEKRVGIFAIKNEVVKSAMEQFEREELQVSYVQMAPMALYNFLLFDRPDLVNSDKRATVVINIGADSTDLVVCTASNVWQRCIMMGGNAFTQAIAEAFKLNPEKAEKLKRTAPVSKYARQIFQAMRPVFTDLAGEVQRSLGFYTSSNPDVRIVRVVGMGGGTKLRGLLKYLSQTLQIPVEKPDAFKRLAIAPGLSSAKFHENVTDFGVVYGLGLQGLGMARIESNLLPTSAARSQAWAGKQRSFIIAAVMFLVVSLMCLGRVGWEKITYAKAEPIRARSKSVIAQGQAIEKSKSGIEEKQTSIQDQMRKQFELFKNRDVVPKLQELLVSMLPNARNNPEQRALYEAFAAGDVAKVMATPRNQRKQLFITHISLYYSDNLGSAQFNKTALSRRDQMTQGMEENPGYDETMMAELEAIYGKEYLQASGMLSGSTEATKEVGFVVTIAGYSPYRQYENLLDPIGVENNRANWGLVTRIDNLDKFLGLEPNSAPFKLYNREAAHFVLEKGVVDPAIEMPAGVGEVQYIPDPASPQQGRMVGMGAGAFGGSTAKQILIDPMTREEIGAEALLDENGRPVLDATGKPRYNDRDHWFTLQFKLLWKPDAGTAAATSTESTSTTDAGRKK